MYGPAFGIIPYCLVSLIFVFSYAPRYIASCRETSLQVDLKKPLFARAAFDIYHLTTAILMTKPLSSC